MQSRTARHAPQRAPIVPVHRGPQAVSMAHYGSPITHAPNAALLIDFDNVTMGIRSDLAGELRNLLSSEIIKGKVAVQRAYADWRRYPQYIVPLAESSIDMIMAPAYGSAKKNATDIRLAVDAMELVFTRAEIGTYILLSGDSDFASLVTKLKEYGKYVIGVGIRESSSDLLVMNCDEYYSYNALAGLVKASDEEVRKWDPWELVVEAIGRMQKNSDVMRSDRLKQVMQDIDATFDERNVGPGYSKFSRFVSDAADKGLLRTTKLDNGQLEVAPAGNGAPAPVVAESRRDAPAAPVAEAGREERGRRSRRGRGRGRDRDDRAPESAVATPSAPVAPATSATPAVESGAAAVRPAPAASRPADAIGSGGERLTRQEAFDLVKRATAALADGTDSALSSDVRKKARELLGRDSESLGERYFHRILRDAHDVEVIDLRQRGDDYEVSLPQDVAPVEQQLKQAEDRQVAAMAASAPVAPAAPGRGMGPRGLAPRGRAGVGRGSALPPELLLLGVVEPAIVAPRVVDVAPLAQVAPAKPAGRARKTAKKSVAKKGAARAKAPTPAPTRTAPAKGGSKAPASRPRKGAPAA